MTTTIKPDTDVSIVFTDSEWEEVTRMLQSLERVEQGYQEQGLNDIDPDRIEKLRWRIQGRDENTIILTPEQFTILSDAELDARENYRAENEEAFENVSEKISDFREILTHDKLHEQLEPIMEVLNE